MTSPALPHLRRDASQHHGTLVAAIGLACVPLIQFGYSYWLSVQGALLLLGLLFVRKRPSHTQALMFVAIALTMLASLLGHGYADTLFYSFLRIVRQLVCMALILFAATAVSWRPAPWFYRRLLPVVVAGLSGLVVLQYVAYTFAGWTYFFVPERLYVQGFQTIADAWLQFGRVHGIEINVRPSATFAEPSYFGFIALALAMLIFKGVHGGMRAALLSMLLVALLCSRSASGVILFVGLVLFAHRRQLSWKVMFIGGVAAFALLFAADLALDFRLLERIANIADPSKERSGYIRLVLPIKHILVVLEQKPLGVPLSELFTFTSRHLHEYVGAGNYGPINFMRGMTEGTDNGFLNMFISYGFGAFVVIGLIYAIVRDKLNLVFLLFVAQFNGDLFAPDKAAVAALVLGCAGLAPSLVRQSRRMSGSRIVTGPFGATYAVRR